MKAKQIKTYAVESIWWKDLPFVQVGKRKSGCGS